MPCYRWLYTLTVDYWYSFIAHSNNNLQLGLSLTAASSMKKPIDLTKIISILIRLLL